MGELAALGAALCWSLASLLFERFGRSAGGLALNTIKCALALVLGEPVTAGMTAGMAVTLAGRRAAVRTGGRRGDAERDEPAVRSPVRGAVLR